MRINQRIRNIFQPRKASSFVASFGTVALLGVLFVGHSQLVEHSASEPVKSAQDQQTIGCAVCATFQVVSGTDLYPRIRLKWKPRSKVVVKTAAHPAVVKSTPTKSTPTPVHTTSTTQPPVTTSTPTPITTTPAPSSGLNPFPYGSCTWWADQRYYQIHGVFVPWHAQANALEWTTRAYQYGWHVSSTPVVGAIIDLQPGMQGAYGMGHVAVVEKILSNGHVIASNMSWGAYPWQVTDVEFAPGSGVTFIWQ